MITDLFTSGNQNIDFSAVVAASNASTKGKNLSDFSGNTTNTLDFAAVLSQTIGSSYLVDALTSSESENLLANNTALSSLVNQSQSFDLNSQLKKSSFKTDTFNSSPFVNLSERNSFQATTDVKVAKDTRSTSDTKAASDKKDSTVSKETKKDDTDKTKKADSKEEEKTQKVDENSKEANVDEENTVNEELAVNLEAVEETLNLSELVVEEEVVEADVVVANVDENMVEVNMAAATESDEKTNLSEEDDKEEVEEVKVSTEEKTNPEIFAQNLQNLEQKTDVKEEIVETEVKVEDDDGKKNQTMLKTNEKDVKIDEKADEKVATKEVKHEEHIEGKVEVKEEKPEEKLAEEAISLLQQSEVTENNVNVVASNQNVDTENNKKSKVVEEEETTEEVVEVAEDTQTVKTEVSAKDSNEKSNSNQEKDSKFDKVVVEMKDSDGPIPEESLRQKFAEAIGQDKHQASENPDANLAQQMAGVTEQATQNAGSSSSAADETANKIFEALTGKSEGLNSKQNQTQNLVGNVEGAGKGAGLNQNNGSGMNNGFSFQSGSSQTYNESGKMQQTAHTPAANFSELLTKAEMVKTKDGAKVMNVELEQEGMGKLELELTSKNGEVTARLSAENDLAKAKLEELAPQIKENLQEKGVNLTQINVDVSSRDADDNSEKYLRFGKKGKSNRLNGVESTSVKDVIEEKILPNLRREALNIQSVDLTV